MSPWKKTETVKLEINTEHVCMQSKITDNFNQQVVESIQIEKAPFYGNLEIGEGVGRGTYFTL